MTQSNMVSIPALPKSLRWRSAPEDWAQAEGVLTIRAGQKSDWFLNPSSAAKTMNAPALLMSVGQLCMLSARVTVDAKATFDAGVLCVYQADDVWAKLCFERSPQGQLMIVSVVTRGTSDDANSVPIEGNTVYLRLSKLDSAYAFHYSQDGNEWTLVRHFSLGGQSDVEIGFLAQSPTGDGCTVEFSEIEYLPQKLGDLRSGE
jgi:regulation of enolase protein 1 (concanavalin A-like superfamily)